MFIETSAKSGNDVELVSDHYASVGGATGHTVVGLCICVCMYVCMYVCICVCICLSAGFLVARRKLSAESCNTS